jgi:hypothetical protein
MIMLPEAIDRPLDISRCPRRRSLTIWLVVIQIGLTDLINSLSCRYATGAGVQYGIPTRD